MKTLLLSIFALLTTVQLLAQPVPVWSSSVPSGFRMYFNDKPQIKFDNSGDIVLVGNIRNVGNSQDILVVKYSPAGDILWQQEFNGIHDLDDKATDFIIDAQNNILITGASFIDSVNSAFIAVKYDANGNFEWVNSFDGAANREDEGTSIAIDAMGDAYVTGFTAIDTLYHFRLFVKKIASSGSTNWSYFYGSDSTAIYRGVKVQIMDSQVQVLGTYRNNLTAKSIVLKLDTSGVVSSSVEDVIVRGGSYFYQDNLGNSYIGHGFLGRFRLTKISPSGDMAWSDTIGTNQSHSTYGDEVTAIVVDSAENIYITGRHYGVGTNADIVTVKYSPNGDRLWVRRYDYLGNNAADIASSITLDKNLNVYVAGRSQRITTGSDLDYVVVKYDFNGNEKGTIRYNNAVNGDDAISSIIVDDSSNIYVTGITMDDTLSSTTTQKYNSLVGVGIYEITVAPVYLNAFPNPFSTTTSIRFTNADYEVFNFHLFDYSGRIILKQKTRNNIVSLSSDKLPQGFYTFVLFSDKKIFQGKVVVAR